jgi:hypothetical protein
MATLSAGTERPRKATEVDGLRRQYVGVLISLWLFLFAAQPKELKKLEQRSHKCAELRGEYVV